MRRYLLSTVLVLPFLFLTGCGESIYEGAADTTTNEAVSDQVDFDLIDGRCQPVISYYDNRINSGIVLTDNDMYKYISAILTCSGFDIIGGIDSILTTGGSDIYMTTGALMGIKLMDMNTATNLQSNYDKAISVCYNRKIELEKEGLTLDKTNTTVCGLAGLMGSIVNMSAMMLNTSGGGGNLLELSETGFENFTKDEIDATLAAQSLGSYVKQKDDFLMMLNNGLTIGEDGIDAIGSLMGQNDFGNVLGDLTSQLRDSSGNITEESLLNYLTTSLGLPSIPIP